MRSASRSAELVGRTKYGATVDVTLLMETEGEEKREEMRRKKKNGNHHLTIRFGADGWGNNRANLKFAAFDYGVLESAEIRRRIDNASVSNIRRQVIVSCSGRFNRNGGRFIKNRCGCHVTLKRVRLY